MVCFVCEGCNETLKKKQVESHASRCRNCRAVSCVDCSTVFEGSNYVSHTTCISEAQKCQGAMYNESHTKTGKRKSAHDEWEAVIHEAATSNFSVPNVEDIMKNMLTQSNIPRKRKRFMNFMKSACKVKDPSIAEKIFIALEQNLQVKVSKPAASESNPSTVVNDNAKSTCSDNTKGEAVTSSKERGKNVAKKAKTSRLGSQIDWLQLVGLALEKNADQGMELKVLRQEILNSVLPDDLSLDQRREYKQQLDRAIKESRKFCIMRYVQKLSSI